VFVSSRVPVIVVVASGSSVILLPPWSFSFEMISS